MRNPLTDLARQLGPLSPLMWVAFWLVIGGWIFVSGKIIAGALIVVLSIKTLPLALAQTCDRYAAMRLGDRSYGDSPLGDHSCRVEH